MGLLQRHQHSFNILALLFYLSAFSQVLHGQGSSNPHGAIQFDCQDCHQAGSWTKLSLPLAFNHSNTGYPLSGAHADIKDCTSCHQELNFARVASACVDCHTDIHRQELGMDCQECHNTGSWNEQQNVLLLHTARGFPLAGVHAVADCQSCHINQQQNEFAGVSPACESCHMADFTQTLNPDHRRAQFELDCLSCHAPAALGWAGARFEHSANFELRGAHLATDCNSCHQESYANIPATCISCHQADYDMALDPNHAESAFPENCIVCHNESAWEPAEFNHDLTNFPLTGAHIMVDCANCHTDGYADTPLDCAACHIDEYNQTGNPAHQAAGFPLECEVCHSTNDWDNAQFDHDGLYFPIYSGNHRDEWDNCIDCHISPQNYAAFECIFCHEHRQSEMADKHDEVNDYEWESRACLNCHPDGREIIRPVPTMRNKDQ